MDSILTVGTVVDTNDPQQMGRLRVNCPKWGDTPDTLVVDIPWATYVSPFGGILTRGGRGPEDVTTSGPVAYGMWAIPKVGATVVCMLIDGDPNHRVWMGSVHANHMTHTLPMGRYLDGGTTGPVSSTEQPIEPLASNMDAAFGDSDTSIERLTRGSENQAASIKNTIVDKVASDRADDRSDTSRTGYQSSRIAPDLYFPETGGNFDPQTYSITTPGMHSFVMDDSLKNGKIRIRSTSGNQIILDDTNERIYISTSSGSNYIEMDKNGNIEIHSDNRVSIHSTKDINLTAAESIRMSAANIHMRASSDIRMDANSCVGIHSGSDMVIQTEADFDLSSTTDFKMTSGGKFDVESNGDVAIGSVTGNLDLSALLEVWLQSWESDINIKAIGGGNQGIVPGTENLNASIYILAGVAPATGQIAMDASLIQTNNGKASMQILAVSATDPSPANSVAALSKYAYTTNRTPQHEPWGRIMINTTATGEASGGSSASDVPNVIAVPQPPSVLDLSYTDANVGRKDYSVEYDRNDNWRR